VRWFGLTSVVSLTASLACGAGTDLTQIVDVNPESDAGSAASEGGATSFQNPFAGAPGYTARMGQDSHNAGKACLQSGCHGSSEAPSFLLGGTVYADYEGTTPAAGVEVRIVDSAGHAVSTYSSPNGNFYVGSGSANGVTFPAIVGARNATTTRPMITTLSTASMGSCGQTKCHVPGGGPQSGTGNYYPIHVP
jgi:hypothetical protein